MEESSEEETGGSADETWESSNSAAGVKEETQVRRVSEKSVKLEEKKKSTEGKMKKVMLKRKAKKPGALTAKHVAAPAVIPAATSSDGAAVSNRSSENKNLVNNMPGSRPSTSHLETRSLSRGSKSRPTTSHTSSRPTTSQASRPTTASLAKVSLQLLPSDVDIGDKKSRTSQSANAENAENSEESPPTDNNQNNGNAEDNENDHKDRVEGVKEPPESEAKEPIVGQFQPTEQMNATERSAVLWAAIRKSCQEKLDKIYTLFTRETSPDEGIVKEDCLQALSSTYKALVPADNFDPVIFRQLANESWAYRMEDPKKKGRRMSHLPVALAESEIAQTFALTALDFGRKSEKGMDRASFGDIMFQMIDMWVTTTEERHYLMLLDKLYKAFTKRKKKRRKSMDEAEQEQAMNLGELKVEDQSQESDSDSDHPNDGIVRPLSLHKINPVELQGTGDGASKQSVLLPQTFSKVGQLLQNQIQSKVAYPYLLIQRKVDRDARENIVDLKWSSFTHYLSVDGHTGLHGLKEEFYYFWSRRRLESGHWLSIAEQKGLNDFNGDGESDVHNISRESLFMQEMNKESSVAYDPEVPSILIFPLYNISINNFNG